MQRVKHRGPAWGGRDRPSLRPSKSAATVAARARRGVTWSGLSACGTQPRGGAPGQKAGRPRELPPRRSSPRGGAEGGGGNGLPVTLG